MIQFRVTLRLVDGSSFEWAGNARSQYSAESLAVAALRRSATQQIVGIATEEQA
jgi:hypothetical protein